MPKYLVIELTEGEAKILQASKGGKTPPLLETVVIVSFDGIDKSPDGIAARSVKLRDAIRQTKFSGGVIGLILPKQNSIVRTVDLPSVDPDELAGMALFEAEKFIPFNADRHTISYEITRKLNDTQSEVMVAAIDSPVLDDTLAIMNGAGLSPSLAEVSSMALVRGFNATVKLPPETEGGSVLLINIGRFTTDISLLYEGHLSSTRSQNISLDKLFDEVRTSGESWHEVEVTSDGPPINSWISRLSRFVRQTLEFSQREHSTPSPKIVYMSGEGARIDGLPMSISTQLGIPVIPFNPWEKFPKAEGTVISADAISAVSNGYGTLVRLLAEDENPKLKNGRINLLPASVIEKNEAAERRILLAVSATMVLITGILIYLSFDMQGQHRKLLVDRYRSYNKEMRTVVDDIELKKERLAIIDSIKTSRTSPLAVLDQITAYPGMGSTLTGGKVTLTNFKYDRTDDVVIQGMALDLEDVSNFTEYLGKIVWNDQLIFRQIGIPQSSPSEALGKRGKIWTFTITCTLTNPNAEENSGE